jgi:hypothetical protein
MAQLFGRKGIMRVFTQATTLFVAASLFGGCSKGGVEIVRVFPIVPSIYADEKDDLRYTVAVKNDGDSSQSVYLWASVSYNATHGGSCSTAEDKGWYWIGSLDPDETWSSFHVTLASLTPYPDQCVCKKGSCSGSVTFTLYTDCHMCSGSKIVPGDASEVKMDFDQNGHISGYDLTPIDTLTTE